MKRTYKDYLVDMYESAAKIMKFTDSISFQEFNEDDKTLYAVIRAFEILGEASKKIPKSFRDQHLTIPWKDIAGIRDKLIHDYFGVDAKVVWKAVKEEIPSLKNELQSIIDKF